MKTSTVSECQSQSRTKFTGRRLSRALEPLAKAPCCQSLPRTKARCLAAPAKEAVTSVGLKVGGHIRPAEWLVTLTEGRKDSHQPVNKEPCDSEIQHLLLSWPATDEGAVKVPDRNRSGEHKS